MSAKPHCRELILITGNFAENIESVLAVWKQEKPEYAEIVISKVNQYVDVLGLENEKDIRFCELQKLAVDELTLEILKQKIEVADYKSLSNSVDESGQKVTETKVHYLMTAKERLDKRIMEKKTWLGLIIPPGKGTMPSSGKKKLEGLWKVKVIEVESTKIEELE